MQTNTFIKLSGLFLKKNKQAYNIILKKIKHGRILKCIILISNLIGKWDIEFGVKTFHRNFQRIPNSVAGGYIGHSYKVKIGLKANSLKNGMVTDFKHLNFVKSLIDNYLDHRFMLDKNDPLFDAIFPEFGEIQRFYNAAITDYHGFFKYVDTQNLDFGRDALEHIESFVLVDFVPTSENICKFLYDLISAKMGDFLKENSIELSFVELWETPKSHCVYAPKSK